MAASLNKYTALLVIDVQVGIIEGFHAYRGREVLIRQNPGRHETSYGAAFIRAKPRW